MRYNSQLIETDEYVYYVSHNPPTAMIAKYKEQETYGPRKQLVLPSELTVKEGEKYIVDGIHDGAFNDCRASSFVIPDTIKFIECEAFSGSIYYEDTSNWGPESGTLYIGDCMIEADIRFPGSVYEVRPGTRLIADNCFGYCNHIEKIRFPKSLKYIGREAFYECNNLKEIYLPKGLVGMHDDIGLEYPLDLTVHCAQNTYAEKWAKNHGCRIDYTASRLDELISSLNEKDRGLSI